MADKRKYDSTVARVAGNIFSGIAGEIRRGNKSRQGDDGPWNEERDAAAWAVQMARLIVAETERAETPVFAQSTVIARTPQPESLTKYASGLQLEDED